MRSDFVDGQGPAPENLSAEKAAVAGSYEPPAVVVLGTFSELTQQGVAPTDELLSDGVQS